MVGGDVLVRSAAVYINGEVVTPAGKVAEDVIEALEIECQEEEHEFEEVRKENYRSDGLGEDEGAVDEFA